MHDTVLSILQTHIHGNITDHVQNVLVKCGMVVHANLLDIKCLLYTSHSFHQPLNAELDTHVDVLEVRG